MLSGEKEERKINKAVSAQAERYRRKTMLSGEKEEQK